MINDILIADNNPLMVETVAGLLTGQTGLLTIHKAYSLEEAMETLKEHPIRLALTSIRQPKYDGFDLVTRLCCNFPEIRTIVLVSETSPEIRSKFKCFSSSAIFFDQFRDMNMLCQRVLSELQIDYGGKIHGISLPAFLQMLAFEQRSCTLYVEAKSRDGVLRMHEGELVTARTGILAGTDAAIEILRWTNTSIEIDYGTQTVEPQISSSLISLIMDSSRIDDEENHNRTANKRNHDRHDTKATLDYEIGGENRQCVLRDVSLGGAYLDTDHPIEEGDQITVTLSSPTLKARCTVDALVVRKGPHGIGVQFQLANLGQRKVIQSMINACITWEVSEAAQIAGFN